MTFQNQPQFPQPPGGQGPHGYQAPYQQGPYQQGPYQQGPYQAGPNQGWGGPPRPRQTTNVLAVAGLCVALVTGFGTFFFLFFAFIIMPFTLVGLAMSVVGQRQIKANPREDGKEIAWIGIFFNVLVLIVQLFLLVVTVLFFGALGFFATNLDEICESGDVECTTGTVPP